MIIDIKMWCHATDNGDGSNSVSFYPSKEELENDLKDYGLTYERVAAEEDPYNDGYVFTEILKFDTERNTILPFTASAG